MIKILHIVGARPNFMKLAPVYHALSVYSSIEQTIVHSGQHHDINMSDVFFEQLNIPSPDFNLEISGGTSLSQLSKGISSMDFFLNNREYDLVCVYGDVNATAFGAITASKLGIKVAHIEAGLRSCDKSMPEETNRILTDAISDYFFTPSNDATKNLVEEGHDSKNIFMVGNVMIDSLLRNIDKIKNIEQFDNISFLEPLDYFSFVHLEMNAKYVLTDSGGVQEETTFLKVPCFTLRTTTERPITLEIGSNSLIKDYDNIYSVVNQTLNINQIKDFEIPPLWDGNSGERIAKIIYKILS